MNRCLNLKTLLAALGCLLFVGCANQSVQSDIISACEYSNGVWRQDHCVCADVTCTDGIVCNTLTGQCANHSTAANDCQTDGSAISGDEALSLWNANAPAK